MPNAKYKGKYKQMVIHFPENKAYIIDELKQRHGNISKLVRELMENKLNQLISEEQRNEQSR